MANIRNPAPGRTFHTEVFGRAWDEASAPGGANGSKLTACQNLMYRRFGTWAKRPGSTQRYTASQFGIIPTGQLVSGIRWYAAFPTPITQTVVAAQQSLFTGGDMGPLTRIATFNGQNTETPVDFACANDPAALNNNGADILIMCGFSGPYGFAAGSYDVATIGYTENQTASIQIILGATTVTIGPYTVLPTDTSQSIAQALVDLINASTAVTGGAPILGTSYVTGYDSAFIVFGAYTYGTGGNAITYQFLKNGTTVVGPTNLAGGGNQITAPIKYDGTNITGLSYQINQPFTGCVAWHDHVWFWGDPANPDSLYATDIDQPEGFTFMNQYGPYKIGAGDGDPMIRAVVPIGNILYVFKTNIIYAITGYDFQSGDYQFSVEPAIYNTGVTRKENVVALRNAIIFWDGATFQRLQVGSLETEDIGKAIPRTCGAISNGNQGVIRCAAGSYVVQTALNDMYFSVGPASETVVLTNVAMFAVDVGSGIADTVMVYDEDASRFLQEDAWAPWTGWQVGAFLSFGTAESNTAYKFDSPTLMWAPPQTGGLLTINQFGGSATSDVGLTGIANTAISFLAQTGWLDCDSPATQKELHQVYLDLETTLGATFTVTALAAGPVNGVNQTIYPPVTIPFPSTVGNADEESAQVLIGSVNPFLKGFKYMLRFTESSNATAYEINGALLDKIDQPFLP